MFAIVKYTTLEWNLFECEAAEDVAPGLRASFQWSFHCSKTNMWSSEHKKHQNWISGNWKSMAAGDLTLIKIWKHKKKKKNPLFGSRSNLTEKLLPELKRAFTGRTNNTLLCQSPPQWPSGPTCEVFRSYKSRSQNNYNAYFSPLLKHMSRWAP